ncbi:CheR family methyltransferase [Fulvivirga sediminis]|uniref:Protein-glutamate O-methyltransferase CheR n=1 Tax=Fulvivirga sediminis TaxID=2803949 RepID=A0A937F6X9_9BACT|nr:protein-glutamate O-methyltransferase CheR [Fulvivirga sediminis]MBL3655754.1 protein-glutamate O-methyltransferase CheR [Fulvivirga sediminis]
MSVTKAELDSFTNVLFQKYGIDFTCYEHQSLSRRVNRVLHNFKVDNIHELWVMMLRNRNLIFTFMDQISVGLTSMFRDPKTWVQLKKVLSDYKSDGVINVWNAGCSTGEEVYTLTIMLDEIGLLNRVNILATDMNQSAMEEAKKGVYHKVKMIDYEKHYREFNKFGTFSKYYTTDENHIIMKDYLLKNVKFKYHNLTTDQFQGQFDFIFNRNVLIYFDQRMKDKLISQFYQCLKPNGYYIMGFYDSILSEEQKSKFINTLSAFRLFQKPEKVLA